MKKLLLLTILAIGLTGCEPDMCEECWTITDESGSYWTCIEYDCSNEYY